MSLANMILMVAAFVAFLLAAFNVPGGRVNLLGFGAACLTLRLLLESLP